MLKRHWKKGFFLFALNIALYDISLLVSGNQLDFHLFVNYIATLDTIIIFIIFPFLMYIKPAMHIRKDSSEKEQLRLLYQTMIPDAEVFSDEEIYDIISLKTSIPEHSCSKAEYVQYLKRKGLLIINGQHIWLYGTQS